MKTTDQCIEDYNKTKSDIDLVELCGFAYLHDDVEAIVKYYPILFESVSYDSFKKSFINSNLSEIFNYIDEDNDSESLALTTHDLMIVRYMFAMIKSGNEQELKEQMYQLSDRIQESFNITSELATSWKKYGNDITEKLLNVNEEVFNYEYLVELYETMPYEEAKVKAHKWADIRTDTEFVYEQIFKQPDKTEKCKKVTEKGLDLMRQKTNVHTKSSKDAEQVD